MLPVTPLGETSERGSRSPCHRFRPRRPEGGHPGRETRQTRRRRGAPRPARRRLDPYRDDSVEDPAPGHFGAARDASARRPRPDAIGGIRTPGDPAAARSRRRRGRDRDRDHARAVPAQPRRPALGRRALRGRPHGPDRGLRRPGPRRADRDRRRHAPRAAGLGRVRRPHDHRLRRAAQAREPRAADDDDRRRRRDRGRVRVDVRRAGREGDRRRPARPRALVPGRRDRRGLPVPAAAPQRDVPAAREGRSGRGAAGPRRAPAAGLGQGDRLRDRALRDRAPGRHRRARPGQDGAGDRQARPAEGRRQLPHDRAAHLRRGRRLRRPRARGDRDGAGPDRRAARVRSAGQPSCRS